MTERGLPLADGAPACPFVAFEDDRDERSSVPDHRHRCYADARPSPRALAHQEAYCLSSAFPVCPTFQDWARREAARSRGGAPSAPSASAGMNRAATGAAADAAIPAGAAAAAAWSSGGPAASAADVDGRASSGGGDADAGQERDPRDRDHGGLWSGSALPADEVRADEVRPDEVRADEAPARSVADDGRPDDDAERRPGSDPESSVDGVRRNPPRDWAAPPPWLASSERRRPADDADPPAFLGRRASEPGQGLAGSAADRMAGGPPPRRDDGGGDWSSDSRSAAAAAVAGAGLTAPIVDPAHDAHRGFDEDAGEHDAGEGRIPRRPRAYAQHLGGPDGPDWERPRRYEAYPEIKSRVRFTMPGVPGLAGVALLVVVLAAALFFLPGILNFGGSSVTPPAGSANPSQAVQPTASSGPTVPAAPTPQVYTIKKGDILSKIAAQHGITIEELLAANPTIKNPNRISEGQQIVIPAPSAAPPDTIGGSAAP